MPKIKDTDYLSISARIRAMENRLLTRERMERMLEARSDEDAAKVLTECGYGEVSYTCAVEMEQSLSNAIDETYNDLSGAVADVNLVNYFRVKHDYHNAKVIIKSQALSIEPDALFVNGGRYDPCALKDAYIKEYFRDFSQTFRDAMIQAKEVLAVSCDPQASDFVFDRAYFAELLILASDTHSDFLLGYTKLLIDVANLRATVRAIKMARGVDFLNRALILGGDVSTKSLAACRGPALGAIFEGGPLAGPAHEGAAVLAGSGNLMRFERLCDNALVTYLKGAKHIAFGEQPVISYLAAKENEITAVRIIMTGKMAGLDTQIIRERLRDAYV